MTGIILDVFEEEIFMFADGRCTGGDFIIMDNDYKIRKVDEVLYASAGDAHIFDPMVHALSKDPPITNDKLLECSEKIKGDGAIMIASKAGIVYMDVIKKEEEVSKGYMKLQLENLPQFMGSGATCLSVGYKLLSPKKSKNRQIYINQIKRLFKATSQTINSVGTLHQIESIDLY